MKKICAGLVAPAGIVEKKLLDAGVERLRSLGFEAVYLENITEKDMITAGNRERRVNELRNIFSRPDISIVWCVKGGYGCIQLLEELDEIISQHPDKILLGMSDITALHLLWAKIHGSISLYGPMVATSYFKEGEPALFNSLINVLIDRDYDKNFSEFEFKLLKNQLRVPLLTGKIMGGCLSLINACIGTRAEINLNGNILFFEEVSEPLYRLDRMLMQLRFSGLLANCIGVMVGTLTDCLDPDEEICQMHYLFRDFEIPVVYGLQVGHAKDSLTLPLGLKVEIDLEKKTIKTKVDG